MSKQDDWNEEDATWKLLENAKPIKASGCFADDTLRAVRLLPEADPWWPKALRFSPWAAVAACAALAMLLFLNETGERVLDTSPVVESSNEANPWIEIEVIAEEEMLAAAADHLDRFSDQDLVMLIGF
jgi:hypothetical protein